MKEMLEKLNERYMSLKKTIDSQSELIRENVRNLENKDKELSMKTGEIMQLTSKWNKMQGLLKEVKE